MKKAMIQINYVVLFLKQTKMNQHVNVTKILAISLMTLCLISIFTFDYFKPIDTSHTLQHKEISDIPKKKLSDNNAAAPRIALLSSFIRSDMWTENANKKMKPLVDHMINRMCYCHLWNYDCIFNQTQDLTLNHIDHDHMNLEPSLTQPISSSSNVDRWWLKFGCWERVTHLIAALPKYDWVLYGDLDYIVKDMTKPIESFLKEFELQGKDAHVLLPSDTNGDHTGAFSSFALLVRHSPFGMKLLENWMKFALGICPNGNFASQTKEYDWIHSDQPGLWYALMKTHMDFYPNSVLPQTIIQCDNVTGFINDTGTGPWLGFDDYFVRNKFKAGNYGKMLEKVPNDQPIIFGVSKDESRTGLGVDHNWYYNDAKGYTFWKYAFALHYNRPSQDWDLDMQRDLSMCKNHHGCFSSLDENVSISVGCDGERNTTSI